MRAFLKFITSYPTATVLLVVFIVFSGAYSFLHMPVDLFPDLEVPVVNIITHYPGAAPEDMEMLVSRPVEDEMRTIPGIKRVASMSVQGLSLVTAEFSWGTTVRDARQLVQARLARVRNILPQGVRPRLENIDTTLQEVSGYVFYGGGDPVTLRNTVSHAIAGRLMSVEGVSSVDVIGGDRQAFIVTLRPEALAWFHISITEVITALKRHNLTAVAGFIERSGKEYLIRGDARLKTLEDLRSIPVTRNREAPVLLGMVAEVQEGRVPRHYVVRGDGVPAVALIVHKQPGVSTIDVVRDVDKVLLGLKDLLPEGTTVKKFYDQSEIILESRSEIVQDLFVGALLAVLVLYFFLGDLRPTLIVGITIPLTLLATIAVMRSLGLGFNVITMTAMALAIGMIVDDAIVVAENIFRHGKTTSDPKEAAIEGAAEIAGPDASGTFTTVAAFIPLIVVTGIASLFLRPFGLTISSALVVSLLLSLTLVPLLFSRSTKALTQQEGFLGQRLLWFVHGRLQTILKFSFRHRAAVIIVALISLGGAGLLAFMGKAAVLPPMDEGAILIEYIMPPGTSLAESDRIGEILDRIALQDPGVSCVYRRNGSPENGYQIEGVNKGELLIKLRPKTERSRSAAQIIESLKRAYSKIEGCVFLYHQPTQEKIDESFSGLPALFGITIYGVDTEKLAFLAGQVENILSSDPAISNVINNTKVKASEIDVRLRHDRLALYGLEPSEVLYALQAARNGVEATKIFRNRQEVAVIVKTDPEYASDLEALRKMPIGTPNGSMVPLEQIADIRIRNAPSAITHINGQREVTIIAELDGNIQAVVSRLKDRLRSVSLPQGYSIEISGQYNVVIKTAFEMLLAILCAVVLIYFIMVMQFGSWSQPLIILVTIPIALVGAVLALFITGHSLDVSVGMGAVTLAGISVNNAIVLIDYCNKKVLSGMGIAEALMSAVSVRLRPILLTTFTTIAALIPTAIGTTVGSRIFQPFAITVIGGLITAVIATVVIVPVLVLFTEKSKAIS
ncbi:Cobalt-zinc-cadmium resistance protein CzcA/CusA [Dissulfuribacter thermophilus]|uniref:Cobalt-zinc-cadmium resistance protein CzcA/CusA n=1 Tax=Dissulfuribacter thermophilus TaxID=1156395 RepID=A0A1B9F6X1_9BACT|nr:efflux RND transporter permease subunit [Dissulfuribacter thermophilus]OCC15584.1 Cobalt-zinc-cadmium resistance protein CzcA/CusA [Dissulfuribacter thermophilus]